MDVKRRVERRQIRIGFARELRKAVTISVSFVTALATFEASAQVSGVVIDAVTQAPLVGAQVKLRAVSGKALTDGVGAFTLPEAKGSGLVVVAAHVGYWNEGLTVTAPLAGQTIALTPVPQDDNPDYPFLAPGSCGFCHSTQFFEWSGSAMAHTGQNTWVYDVYNGEGTAGGKGGFVYTRDSVHAGQNAASECSACHQPESWMKAPYSAMGDIKSMEAERGVSCEICHKVAHVDETKPNFPGMWPGVVRMTRPFDPNAHQVEYGVLGDVDYRSPGYMRASLQPQLPAALCAACHQDKNDPDNDGDFEEANGVVSEPTYGEWAASPYGDPTSPLYSTCANCHMPVKGTTRVCEVASPPIERDPNTIRSHEFRGTTAEFLENAVSLTVSAEIVDSKILAEVKITNDRTGHAVPTGVTIRNMVLVVDATREEDGTALADLGTQHVDALGGVGDPTQGYFAGLPGKVYAKRNVDAEGKGPVFYTDATGIELDDRILPLATDVTNYSFAVPVGGGTLRVRARLIYRRSFRALVDQKGWSQDGHGKPLADLTPPHFGHLMAKGEATVALPCDPDVCVDGGTDAGSDGGDEDAGLDGGDEDASSDDGGGEDAGVDGGGQDAGSDGGGASDAGTGGGDGDAGLDAGGATGDAKVDPGAVSAVAHGGGCGCAMGERRGTVAWATGLTLGLAAFARRRKYD
jgi:hypothetical protein